MSNVYYSPQEFGLTTVGEIEWGDGCYSFDLTVVWRRDSDGALLYADDSGCSCPSPFEDHGLDDLTVATPAELQAHLEQVAKDRQPWRADDEAGPDIAELMARVMS